ncbi:hypothetical protein D3C79_610180 [compost metagenome]
MPCMAPFIGSMPNALRRTNTWVTSSSCSGVFLAKSWIQALASAPPAIDPITALSCTSRRSAWSPVWNIATSWEVSVWMPNQVPAMATRRPVRPPMAPWNPPACWPPCCRERPSRSVWTALSRSSRCSRFCSWARLRVSSPAWERPACKRLWLAAWATSWRSSCLTSEASSRSWSVSWRALPAAPCCSRRSSVRRSRESAVACSSWPRARPLASN